VRRARKRTLPLLRPRAGRRLPPELRADRVGRLAQALAGGVEDPGFEPLLTRIDEGPFHPGNRVSVYFSGREAFDAMLADVASAASEILLESYILKDDATGAGFQAALIAAAARGVRVRVLADALGSFSTRRAFWRELERHGIESRLFHPFGVPLRFLKFRDHRKILVIDRRVAYTGGMNIGDEYGSSLLPTDRVFRDTHARAEGPAAWEMAVVFREGWSRARGSAIAIEPIETPPVPGARVMILDSRPRRGAREVASVLAAIAGAARRRLWVTAAYFAPRPRVLSVLGAAAERGVDVRLLVPGKTDVHVVRHAGHGFFTKLLSCGVRIFEYQPAILHAKTLVADGRVTVIGSSNIDFRSFERNAECNFAILDEAVGARMEAQYEEDLTRSVEIRLADWKRRPWFHRLRDALARRLTSLL
jgi:cardiolipin synthase